MNSRLTLRSRHMGILIVIILAMSYVGITGIGADSIWHDEYRSIYYAGGMSDSPGSPLDAIARASERQSGDGLLYPLLLAVWGRFAGFSVFSARYLSLLLGVLAIAWIYRLASDLHSPSAGLFAAIALGASAFLSVYLHEIGPYSLMVLEVVLLLWLYWLILLQGPTRLSAFAFLLVLMATLYTSPLVIVSIAALGVYHLMLAPRTKSWNLLIVLAIVAEVLFLPWLLTTNSAAVKFVEHAAGYSAVDDSFYLLQNIGHAFGNGIWLFWLLPFFSLRWLRGHIGLKMLWLVGTSTCTVILVVYQVSDLILHVRYMVPLLPIFALLFGIASALPGRFRRLIWTVLLIWCAAGTLVASSYSTLFYPPDESKHLRLTYPFAEVLGEITKDAVANDAIALEFPFHAWAIRGVTEYYLRGSSARYVLTDNLVQGELESQSRIAGFEHFLGDAGRVYFVVDRTVAPSAELMEYEKILSARYVTCDRLWDTDKVRVDKLAQINALCGPPQTPIEQFGDSVALLDFVHVRTDDFDVFYSIWSTEEPMESHSQAIHFRKEDGELVYQIDGSLPHGEFAYRIDRIPRGELPASAAIKIQGIVYNWQTGERLKASDGSDIVELGQVQT